MFENSVKRMNLNLGAIKKEIRLSYRDSVFTV